MKNRAISLIVLSLGMLALAALACTAPGAQQPTIQPTAQAIATANSAQAETTPSVSAGPLAKREVKNAAQRQAVCNDGSPAVYYFRPGSGTDAAKWLIFFEGGGFCGSDKVCSDRWEHDRHLMTTGAASDEIERDGIFSTSEQHNPDFAHFTQVFINYCSSDVYAGDAERMVGGRLMQFRGHKIVAAILADLQDAAVTSSPNLKDASEVLVGGSSAGSFGAGNNLDWIASELPWAKVKGVLDSSWGAPLDAYGPSSIAPVPGSVEFYDFIQATGDQSCEEANPDQPHVCLSTVNLYPYFATPVFIYADQRDPTLLQFLKGITNPGDLAQRAYIEKYEAAVRESLKKVTAVFSPSVGRHTALADDKFFDIRVNGRNFAETLGAWYFGRPGPIRIIDGEAP